MSSEVDFGAFPRFAGAFGDAGIWETLMAGEAGCRFAGARGDAGIWETLMVGAPIAAGDTAGGNLMVPDRTVEVRTAPLPAR
jgi:hypothetical protein